MRSFEFKYMFMFAVFSLFMIGGTVSSYAESDIEFKIGKTDDSDIVLENGEDDNIEPSVAFGRLDADTDIDVDAGADNGNSDGISFDIFGEESEKQAELVQEQAEDIEEVIIYEPEPALDKGYREVRYFEPYSYNMNVEATFYFYHDVWPEGSGTGLTYTGNKCIPWYTIAVDPSVIPLGSKVIINGREYLADDVGGAIKGNKIDIATWSREEAFRYGRRYLDIKVIPPGGKGEYKVIKISPDKANDKEYISSLGEQAVLID